jgi:hypothetical protein
MRSITGLLARFERNGGQRDQARAIIERRADVRARQLHVTKGFMLIDMNWRALIPVMRALLGPDGTCPDCGRGFRHDRDIAIDHLEPPRRYQDWAREHARNLSLVCCSCNSKKQRRSLGDYLDNRPAGARQLRLTL